MTWISTHRDKWVGYRVALDAANHRNAIGWVEFDPIFRIWRAACRHNKCGELGQAYRKPNAGELIREHWLREHR